MFSIKAIHDAQRSWVKLPNYKIIKADCRERLLYIYLYLLSANTNNPCFYQVTVLVVVYYEFVKQRRSMCVVIAS